MDTNDLDKYKANLDWFNLFFQDIKQLLDRIADRLAPDFAQAGTSFYYPKSNYSPSIPSYLLMGLGGESTALQIFAAIDPEIIGNNKYFKPEPSLFIINHSEKEKYLYVAGYGLNVIQNKSEDFDEIEDGVISGRIPGNEEVHFQAFQVPLSLFTTDRKVDEIIHERIVNVIYRLPENN